MVRLKGPGRWDVKFYMGDTANSEYGAFKVIGRGDWRFDSKSFDALSEKTNTIV